MPTGIDYTYSAHHYFKVTPVFYVIVLTYLYCVIFIVLHLFIAFPFNDIVCCCQVLR
jgi:hypothetical protein